MADFEDLKVYNGVGPYHLNRYRIAFEYSAGLTKEMLAADFVARFPAYLGSPYATTEFSTRTHNGNATLKFWGSMKLLKVEANPGVHHDWVVQAWKNPAVGFTAQTLKRNFLEVGDAAAAFGGSLGGGAVVPILGGPVGAVVGVEENRKHFLAGRRSWRIDNLAAFGVDPQEYNSPPASDHLLILETVAVERFSDTVYTVGDAVVGFEARIPPVWIANLENFVNLNRGKGLVPRTRLWGYGRAGWKSAASTFPTIGGGYVSYFQDSFADLAALKSDFEFTEVFRLFPTILP